MTTKGLHVPGRSVAAVHASGKSPNNASSVAGVRVNTDRHSSTKFDKIWFHGRSVLLPNTQISVTDHGFHLIPHRFEFRRLKSGLQTPLVPGFVRIFQQPHHVGKRVRVSLAAKNMASEETEPFEYIGGVRSYKVDSFRVAG